MGVRRARSLVRARDDATHIPLALLQHPTVSTLNGWSRGLCPPILILHFLTPFACRAGTCTKLTGGPFGCGTCPDVHHVQHPLLKDCINLGQDRSKAVLFEWACPHGAMHCKNGLTHDDAVKNGFTHDDAVCLEPQWFRNA